MVYIVSRYIFFTRNKCLCLIPIDQVFSENKIKSRQRCRGGRDRTVVEFTTTCAINVSITTKVLSSNSVDGEVYSIQQYVIKFVSFLRFPPPIKLTHDIIEILLKMALSTITLPYPQRL